MRFLSDEEILDLLSLSPPILKGVEFSVPLSERTDTDSSLYSAGSPVQPASVDLHVGEIFVPGEKKGHEGAFESPITHDYRLRRGETVLVSTKEEFNLPNNMAGIGFTPFRVALRGVFITSVGHVDPGYKGPLRLIVINMGNDTHTLGVGDRIATCLLFELGTPARKGYAERHTQPAGERAHNPVQRALRIMAKDFLSLDDRMKGAIDDRLHHSWTTPLRTIVASVALAALIAVASPLVPILYSEISGTVNFRENTLRELATLKSDVRWLKQESQQQRPQPPQAIRPTRPNP